MPTKDDTFRKLLRVLGFARDGGLFSLFEIKADFAKHELVFHEDVGLAVSVRKSVILKRHL